jgi:hypothetical protein
LDLRFQRIANELFAVPDGRAVGEAHFLHLQLDASIHDELAIFPSRAPSAPQHRHLRRAARERESPHDASGSPESEARAARIHPRHR